jgi:hypothetical protein
LWSVDACLHGLQHAGQCCVGVGCCDGGHIFCRLHAAPAG